MVIERKKETMRKESERDSLSEGGIICLKQWSADSLHRLPGRVHSDVYPACLYFWTLDQQLLLLHGQVMISQPHHGFPRLQMSIRAVGNNILIKQKACQYMTIDCWVSFSFFFLFFTGMQTEQRHERLHMKWFKSDCISCFPLRIVFVNITEQQ